MAKRLYVDMDGTLAVFNNQIESEEVLFQKGYYRDLPPQQNVVDAVRLLTHQEPNLEVFILSAVLPSPYAEQEKKQWLDTFLPEVDKAHRIFVPCGEDKGKYIGHELGENDLLLDDYSKNLHSWCPPGSAVKLMNGINGNFKTWQGNRVSMDMAPAKIAEKLLIAFGLKKRLYKSYEIIESRRIGKTEIVIGRNAAPGSSAPYMVWLYRERIGFHMGESCESYGKAYQAMLWREAECKRIERTQTGAQIPPQQNDIER